MQPLLFTMITSKKATHHYVGTIVKPTDEFSDEFEVTFMKCSKKSATANRLTIHDEEDIVDVPFDDIVARLPVPTVLGGTADGGV